MTRRPQSSSSLESSNFDRKKVCEPGVRLYLSKTSDFVSLVQTIDQLLGLTADGARADFFWTADAALV